MTTSNNGGSNSQQQQRQQMHSSSNQQQQTKNEILQRRLMQMELEQQQLRKQIALQNFASIYPIQLLWPAQIVSGNTNSSILRTSKDLIQHRILEHGILYDDHNDNTNDSDDTDTDGNNDDSSTTIKSLQTTTDIAQCCTKIIADLHRTDCFDAIQIQIGTPVVNESTNSSSDDATTAATNDNKRTIEIKLHEKKWYTLYVGAGSKELGFGTNSNNTTGSGLDGMTNNNNISSSFLPVAEINVIGGLRNITGFLDKSEIKYTIDTKSLSSLSLSHNRPLYSILPESIQNIILEQTNGSQYEMSVKGILDTIDNEYIRGYKEYQRYVSYNICNIHNINHSPINALVQTNKNWYINLEWLCIYRDIIPRRHSSSLSPTSLYNFDACKSIISFAGPSIKNSFNFTMQYNSPDIVNTTSTSSDETATTTVPNNPLLPTKGYQIYTSTEIATPPGDVGFIKGQVSASKHWLVSSNTSFHLNTSTGYIYPLSFGNLCNNYSTNAGTGSSNTIHPSDRFYIGGTSTFRGFVPGGIGPRGYVNSNNTSTNNTTRTGLGGNSLGGDFYYTTTAMVSTAALDTVPIISHYLNDLGVRLFCYTTFGTCCTINNNNNNNNNNRYYGRQSSNLSLLRDVISTTRVSSGIGMTTTAFGPKLEVSYSIPIRYSPMDGRKLFQFGMSFSV